MINNIWKSKKGQAMVELVLVLPILLLLVFGITEFGRMFGTELILSYSAREGARAAAVGSNDGEVTTKIHNSSSVLNSANMTISISPDASSRKRGDSVTVQIQYPVNIYAPIISNFVGDPYQANGEAIMRVE